MDIRFQEIQYLPEIGLGSVAGVLFEILFLWRRLPLPLNITICISSFPVLLLAFELQTIVDDRDIRVRFGRIPIIQYAIRLDEIAGYEAISYTPVDDSWGVWQDETGMLPFLPRGHRALLLTMRDGNRYLIASRRITELQKAIEAGTKRSAG